MTNTEIIQLSIPALGKLAGEVLREKPWEHSAEYDYYETWKPCIKCGEKVNGHLKHPGECTIADPIDPEDWTEVMRWRDWCVEKHGENKYIQACMDIFNDIHELDYSVGNDNEARLMLIWFATEAQPHHYLRAILLCEEGAGK